MDSRLDWPLPSTSSQPEFFEEQEQKKRKIIEDRLSKWDAECQEIRAIKAKAAEALAKAKEAIENYATVQVTRRQGLWVAQAATQRRL